MFVSGTDVAYYAPPYEIVTKLQVIPSALAGVLFPAFSATLVSDGARARQLYTQGLAITLALLLALTAMVVAFAHSGLAIWLGAEFALHGYRVLQFLAVGVLINACAYLPASFLHAAGRPDVTAKMRNYEVSRYTPLGFRVNPLLCRRRHSSA